MTRRMTPAGLFRLVARAEAVTWALLLSGMFLKYVTRTTELGVQVFGMVHGVVFVAYCVATVVVAVDQRWRIGRIVLGLACAVPPFATVPFERYAARAGLLSEEWRLRTAAPRGVAERLVSWLVRRPGQGLLAGVVAVGALTGLALLVGPPA
jgi:integral membrane protein